MARFLLQALLFLSLFRSAVAFHGDSFAGFPKLKPAFTMRLVPVPVIRIGKGFGSAMTASGPIRNGTIQSVPGYGSEALFGEVTHANDIFHIEADFRSTELQFTALIQPLDGEAVTLHFIGYIYGNEETIPIMKGDPKANSTNWGSAFLEAKFETGNPKWDLVNRKIFVGAQRLLLEPGEPLNVLINFSEVYYHEDYLTNEWLQSPSAEEL